MFIKIVFCLFVLILVNYNTRGSYQCNFIIYIYYIIIIEILLYNYFELVFILYFLFSLQI